MNKFEVLDTLKAHLSEGELLDEVVRVLSEADALGIFEGISNAHDLPVVIDMEDKKGNYNN